MNVSAWIRQSHRWLSIVFTISVIANFVYRAAVSGEPPMWLTYSPLPPLLLQLISGLYLFVLPYTCKRHSTMKVHYLEIVSLDVDAVCKAYESANDVEFGAPDEFLGGARTCKLPDGSIVGVRAPMRDTEDPVVRPYWLVDDIDSAVLKVEAQGAKIAMHPMEIPGRGKFAIFILGSNDHGLWQL